MEVYIVGDECSEFIKELVAYNGTYNIGEEMFTDNYNEAETKKITIDDFWFLAV